MKQSFSSLVTPFLRNTLRRGSPGNCKFLVMPSPTLINPAQGNLSAGEYRLPPVEGVVHVTGQGSSTNKEVFVISNIQGSGEISFSNVILMVNDISSTGSLVVNIDNCQVIAETLTLDNVTLNITNSSFIIYPQNKVGILGKNSCLNATNTNFTLLSWLDNVTFFSAETSNFNIDDSEIVFVSSLPTQTTSLLLINSVNGVHKITNNVVFIIAKTGSVQLYTVDNTDLSIDSLDMESTITNFVNPTANNSQVSLIDVIINGQIIAPPSQPGIPGQQPQNVMTQMHNATGQTQQPQNVMAQMHNATAQNVMNEAIPQKERKHRKRNYRRHGYSKNVDSSFEVSHKHSRHGRHH